MRLRDTMHSIAYVLFYTFGFVTHCTWNGSTTQLPEKAPTLPPAYNTPVLYWEPIRAQVVTGEREASQTLQWDWATVPSAVNHSHGPIKRLDSAQWNTASPVHVSESLLKGDSCECFQGSWRPGFPKTGSPRSVMVPLQEAFGSMNPESNHSGAKGILGVRFCRSMQHCH